MRTPSGHPSNNFDFLRLLAAALVILGHHYVVFGRLESVPGLLGKGVHVLGVEIFFAISGYLVASSWKFDANLPRFMLKRSLRIFPALIGVCVFSVFLLGPIFTNLSAREYFSSRATYGYFSNVWLYVAYSLPGLFEGNVIKAVVNGSLWSLPAEFSMYLLVAFLGLCAALRVSSRVLWAGALLASVLGKYYLSEVRVGPPPIVWGTSVTATLEVGVYFVGGAFIASLGDRFKPSLVLAVVSIALIFALPLSVNRWVDALLFPYAVLALGMLSTPYIREAGRFGDFSYGLYLYAFPIQQALYQTMGLRLGLQIPLLLTLGATLALAAVSWHWIEKPSLRYKPTRGAKIKLQSEASSSVGA
ncbi:acyltransferase [Variovorax sp. J22P168]|uniref:acyltransferase family protein n=1 Tax=Variovorax jilinensis TaxID=3053513 RepID=UPI0025785AF9|nr:acyltransferase [Variovorax sp. J22P168]MDM0011076.1 acyltransferase [Variovorax sp. J22P168]